MLKEGGDGGMMGGLERWKSAASGRRGGMLETDG